MVAVTFGISFCATYHRGEFVSRLESLWASGGMLPQEIWKCRYNLWNHAVGLYLWHFQLLIVGVATFQLSPWICTWPVNMISQSCTPQNIARGTWKTAQSLFGQFLIGLTEFLTITLPILLFTFDGFIKVTRTTFSMPQSSSSFEDISDSPNWRKLCSVSLRKGKRRFQGHVTFIRSNLKHVLYEN